MDTKAQENKVNFRTLKTVTMESPLCSIWQWYTLVLLGSQSRFYKYQFNDNSMRRMLAFIEREHADKENIFDLSKWGL